MRLNTFINDTKKKTRKNDKYTMTKEKNKQNCYDRVKSDDNIL